MKRLLLLLPLTLIAYGCNQTPPPADGSAITARSDAWEAAFNAKDLDALMGLYTSDTRLLPPNQEMQTGSAAVRASFSGMLDAGLSGELTSIEATVAGDVGYNVGTYAFRVGGEQVDKGKFIEIWRRGDDGQWRISNDIFNSDMPAAPAEAHATHLMIFHEVEDGDRWMAAWRGENSRHKLFEDNGAAHVHTFQSAGDPTLTGLVIAVSDMDALNAMLDSEEGATAASADGVKLDTIIVLSEAE